MSSWRCFDFLQEALALQLRKHVLEAVLGAEVFEKLSIEQCQVCCGCAMSCAELLA